MVGTGVREAQLVVFLSPCLPSGVPGMGIRNRSRKASSARRALTERKDLIAFISWGPGT